MQNFDGVKKALIVAPHPDDAELGMGGSIARMISSGCDVTVVDLTDGEPTPFGSKEIRAKETALASKILGLNNRICMDMPNRYLEATIENRKRLAEVIRQILPDTIFATCQPDWHPDHVAATKLIEAARFEAKYHKTDLKGLSHWTPELYYYYSPHRLEYPKPSFVMDISEFWGKKIGAINAYQSQLKNSTSNQLMSLTEKSEIVAKYFGLSINTIYGEPFMRNNP